MNDLVKTNKELTETLHKSSQEIVKLKGAQEKANKDLTELKQKLQRTSNDKSNNAKANKEVKELNHKVKSADKRKKREKTLEDQTTEIEIAYADFMKQDQELNNIKEELKTALAECSIRNKKYEDLKAKTTNQIHELTSANDELRTRLRAQFGAKLQDNNPNIADLSDPNRPTKLAEQFSGLYDDEWTNSYEVIMKEQKSEEAAVNMLLRACSKIYSHCIVKASADLQKLHDVFSLFNSGSDIQLLKRLKDERKKYKADPEFRTEIEVDMTTVFGEELFQSKIIKTYCQKCLEICWYMAIQDPPVFMDTQIDRKGKPFDNDAYRPYTQAGQLVKFIVWPALYINEGGSLLYKGVAQGIESEVGTQSLKSNKKSSTK